jgi:protein-S-isoprenylcysteine O-methyltransferase Ste14
MKSLQGKIPLLLSFLLITLCIALSIIKLHHWEGYPLIVGIVLVSLYCIWILLELKVSVGEVEREKTARDCGTMEFYALSQGAVVITALAVPTLWKESGTWVYLGPGIFFSGVILRLSAIKMLGDFYSHRVRLQEDHAIIDRGPYRFIRHPAYAGMLLAHAGFVIFFFNVPSGICFAILCVSVIIRIRVEEKMLFNIEGYREYSDGRKRLIPLIW